MDNLTTDRNFQDLVYLVDSTLNSFDTVKDNIDYGINLEKVIEVFDNLREERNRCFDPGEPYFEWLEHSLEYLQRMIYEAVSFGGRGYWSEQNELGRVFTFFDPDDQPDFYELTFKYQF